MQAEIFNQIALNNSNFDYGICPPPTKPQVGLDILIDHFLGEDWYVALPLSVEQTNTAAIYQILKYYPTKKDKKEKLRVRLIDFINKLLK